ncbi:hypothetical protein ABLE91_14900 [Aquabacter sp. CN5-332]|uniref:arsenate reductase/protein-tyrosine-phosphatase family protein n=1 Tax=Aquabacter sp. CN5-332 TaxID=3156608 RepID=UPI0032B4A728
MKEIIRVLGALFLLALSLLPAAAQVGPLKIAFVDTGNTGRSITAETMARIYALSHTIDARFISRGIDVNPYEEKVEMNAQVLWSRKGVDLSGHVAAQVTDRDMKRSDVVLTLTQKHKDHLLAVFPEAAGKTFTLSEYAGSGPADVEDPWGKPMDAYERMFSELTTLVPTAVEKAAAERAAIAARAAGTKAKTTP